jgi:hypothetical protein
MSRRATNQTKQRCASTSALKLHAASADGAWLMYRHLRQCAPLHPANSSQLKPTTQVSSSQLTMTSGSGPRRRCTRRAPRRNSKSRAVGRRCTCRGSVSTAPSRIMRVSVRGEQRVGAVRLERCTRARSRRAHPRQPTRSQVIGTSGVAASAVWRHQLMGSGPSGRARHDD